MIIYCDTSALMKLFVIEQHSRAVQAWASESTHLMVSQLTWAEMCAGLALKQRTNQVNAQIATTALDQLHKAWPNYSRLALDEDLMIEAGKLALRFGLRAYDSVQLASAQRVHRQLGENLTFCCFDKQLNAAATALSITVAVE
ncbi:MAG: type II toxin-antitoxin system VapC family toxin [Polaromonas sp.]|nr:type II toxin-antitoxin system VapC family toxin [Polaromonas sp.]